MMPTYNTLLRTNVTEKSKNIIDKSLFFKCNSFSDYQGIIDESKNIIPYSDMHSDVCLDPENSNRSNMRAQQEERKFSL